MNFIIKAFALASMLKVKGKNKHWLVVSGNRERAFNQRSKTVL